MSSMIEFAKLFKDRDNVLYSGPVTGVVLSEPPSIKIQLGDKIILDKDYLVCASSYQVVKGEEVILLPSTDGQIYYLLDKAVRY